MSHDNRKADEDKYDDEPPEAQYGDDDQQAVARTTLRCIDSQGEHWTIRTVVDTVRITEWCQNVLEGDEWS